MEITTRQKEQGNLYWFGHPESRTLRPVLDCITSIMAGLHGRGVDGLLPNRAPLPALYWEMDKVGGPESRSVKLGNLS
jgi:hypothetical protein